jgi:hypothetical protein
MDDIPVGPEIPANSENTPQSPEASVDNTQWLSGEKGNPLSPETISTADMGGQPPASPSATMETPQVSPPVNQSTNLSADPQSAMTSPIVGPHSSSGGGGFKIFMILGIFIIVGVWAGVGYLYYQNQNLKGPSQDSPESETTQILTPTPEFTPDQIKIKSGSVVREKPQGETSVLVNKENYESTGITGFLKVAVSPNNSKMCFESWAPAPEPALYLADIDGQNVTEASPNRQNCLWSADSMRIFYINTASKTAPVNIFKYDLVTSLETNLTADSVPAGVVRRYELVGLSADGTKVICKYEDAGGAATTDNLTECEIVLETGEVNPL